MLSLLTVGLVGRTRACGSGRTRTVLGDRRPAHYLLLNAPDRRVRAPEARVHALLAEGLHRSRTFAALMTALNRTDVIVYVESVMTLPKDTNGPFDDGAARQRRVPLPARADPRRPVEAGGHRAHRARTAARARDRRGHRGPRHDEPRQACTSGSDT